VASNTFGICAYGYQAADALALAQAADEFGFHAIWLGEHYIIPKSFRSSHPGMDGGIEHDEDEILAVDVHIHDLWFLLGAMAGCTTNLKVGTAICIAPMLHPLFVARASVTAHRVSGGRLLLGLGAGWLKEEFEAYGLDFHTRGARLDDTIAVLQKAWQGGFFSHASEYSNFDTLQISPTKVDIPLIGGGNSPPAIRRTARVADGWINSAMIPLEEALRLRDQLEAERINQGTGGRPFTYYLRPPTAAATDVEPFHGEGFNNIVLWGHDLWSPDPTIPIAEKREKLADYARVMSIRSKTNTGTVTP
jgi:probable F420-dependent oxidoreductase